LTAGGRCWRTAVMAALPRCRRSARDALRSGRASWRSCHLIVGMAVTLGRAGNRTSRCPGGVRCDGRHATARRPTSALADVMPPARRAAGDRRRLGARLRSLRSPGVADGSARRRSGSGDRLSAQDAQRVEPDIGAVVGSDRIDMERLKLCFELEESTSVSALVVTAE
jgi:hypothetical protein